MNDTFDKLKATIPLELVRWRVGAKSEDKTMGRALPYIDARIVQNRLDDVLGPMNWKNAYVEVFTGTRLLAVRCLLSIRVADGEWVTKEDIAYLSAKHTTDLDAENAVKGVYSDALKRAAVQWGVARHLYDYRAPWVLLTATGQLSEIPSLYGEAPTPLEAPAPVVQPPEAEVATPPQPEDAPATDEGPVAQEPASTAPEAEAQAAELPPATAEAAPVGEGNTHYAQIVDRLNQATMSVAQLRQYVQGPRGKERFSALESQALLKLMADKEKMTTA